MARIAYAQTPAPIRRINDDRDILVDSWFAENETIQVFKPMYRALHDFIQEEGYSHPQSGDEVVEDLYWERWGGGLKDQKEQWAWWRFKKDQNQYIRYLCLYEWQTLYVNPDQKMIYKGKPVKGKVERVNLLIHAKFYLQFDIQDKFLKSIVWKFKKVFFNRMYQQEIEQHKKNVLVFSQKVQKLIKSMMTLETDGEWVANQYGPLGYGDWHDPDMRIT